MPDKNNEWNKMRKIDENVEKKRMKIRSYQIIWVAYMTS